MNVKPKIQIFLRNLTDEKATETARRMPFLKRDFKIEIVHLNGDGASEGAFQDSGLPLIGVDVAPLPPDDLVNYLEAYGDVFKDEVPEIALAALPGPEAAAFLTAARAAGVPLVLAEFDDQPCMISTLEELSALYFSDLILPATRNLQRALTKALPTLASRTTHLLPHSADTTYIQLTKEDRQRLRQNLRVDADLKMITMVAPFDRRRDHDTLIDACAQLKKSGHHFILLLVGEGPERPRIVEKIYALQLQDYITIIDDPKDHLDILCATDIFALCTHFEGNNIPLLEAMAQGLAIAATDVPGISDLIRDERSGRLAKMKDVESFSQALIDLLAQEKTRKKLGSVARKCVENRGNLQQFMPVFIKLLKNQIKALEEGAKPRKKIAPRDGHLGRQYLKLQKTIRSLWSDVAPGFGVAQAADMLDGFPLHTQVDLLEKLCDVKVEPGPLALFVRPLEKVLADRFYEHIPLLEMRLYEKLAAFYIELGYTEGAQKLIEKMEQNIQKELFHYHHSCNRFSGLRAHTRLAQLYHFTGESNRRDYYRLEMWEYMRPNEEAPELYFHQQNAVFLEALGEVKLAARELQKDSLGTVDLLTALPLAIPVLEMNGGRQRPKVKPQPLRIVPKNAPEPKAELVK